MAKSLFGFELWAFGFEPTVERQPDFLEAWDPVGPPRVRDLALAAAIVASTWLVKYATDLYPGLGRILLDTLLIVYFLAAARRLPLRHAAAQPQRYLATFGLPFVLLLLRSKVGQDNADLICCLLLLLLLGGFILQFVKRPRGAEVDWKPLIILALVLFGPVVAELPLVLFGTLDEKEKECRDTFEKCAVQEVSTPFKKCRDAFEACVNAS